MHMCSNWSIDDFFWSVQICISVVSVWKWLFCWCTTSSVDDNDLIARWRPALRLYKHRFLMLQKIFASIVGSTSTVGNSLWEHGLCRFVPYTYLSSFRPLPSLPFGSHQLALQNHAHPLLHHSLEWCDDPLECPPCHNVHSTWVINKGNGGCPNWIKIFRLKSKFPCMSKWRNFVSVCYVCTSPRSVVL